MKLPLIGHSRLYKMRKIISLLVAAIFLASFVYAIGASFPRPQNIELTPGQSSYFAFQIQTDESPVSCVPVIQETQGLELAFNQKYDVEANEKYVVKPQVIVPEQTPFGDYTATFCVECTPISEAEGSKVIPKICGLPITVKVVSERTRENMFEPAPAGYDLWITLLIIAIVILAIIIYYLIRKKSR